MKKRLFLILITTLLFHAGYSQDYYSRFIARAQANDTVGQLEVLTEWKANNPDDAELYTCYFNYHFNKGRKESVALMNEPTEGENFLRIVPNRHRLI
ncbi:hypothetical protein AB9P05_21750 [Roseivirga sp. BDSF3-8]|uniref:hypothetical protein n=1 Tax=Roseivirga sp. BDSF3-8 TaxID=3241598 RepID=UPI0035326AAE